MSDRVELTEVGYCGLYCGLCASRRRIPDEARRLRDSLHAEGYDLGYVDDPDLRERLPAFWETLAVLAERPCSGCRAGGGDPTCPMRVCAQERGLDVCSACEAFPCQRIVGLRGYPTLLSDNERMREVGLEAWIAEQEARAARGFSYQDIRHPRSREGLIG